MISYDKKVFYVLIVVLSIIAAYKKSVAKAQPLGKGATSGGGGTESGIETSDKNIGFIVGGIGGSILLTAIVMYYRNRIAGGGSSSTNYGVR